MTVLFAGVLVILQAVAGAYFWRLLNSETRASWVELGGLGLGLGSALAVLAGCLGFLFPTGSFASTWMWALPAVVAAVVWLWRRSRRVLMQPVVRASRGEVVGAAVGTGLGLVLFAANIGNYPLSGQADWTRYHQDMVFFEGLASGTSQFSPADSVFMAGDGIRYHWLTYAWVGQLSSAIGAEPFFVLTRLLPLVALIGTVLIAVSWARKLSQVWWVPTLAAVLIVTGGYVGAIYGAILNFDSPSQALTTMWLLALIVGLLVALRGGSLVAWFLFALVMSLAVAGGKFSTIVVAAGGFGLLTVVGLWRGAEWRWRAVWLSGAGVLGVVLTYVLMVSGSAQAGGLGLWSLMDRASSVQGLNPIGPPAGVVAGIGLLILAIAARWAGLAWRVAQPSLRWEPETIAGIGMVIVAVGSIALLSGGFNDMWFALAASAPLAVLSAVGLGEFTDYLEERTGRPAVTRWMVMAGGLGVLFGLVVAVIWGTGASAVGGWRWLAPLVGWTLAIVGGVVLARVVVGSSSGGRWVGFGFVLAIVVVMAAIARPVYLLVDRLMKPEVSPFDFALFEPVYPYVDALDKEPLTVITPGQREAGSVLRETAARTDIVATNVTNSPLVPALTGMRAYVSGIHYQAPYGRPDALDDVLIRERESWEFIDAPSDSSAAALCEAGVGWVWVALPKTQARDWEPWGEVVHASSDVALVRLDDQVCANLSGTVDAS